MFSFLSKSSSVDEMKQAQALFEKVVALKTDTHEAQRTRVRMGMLCRAHLDKTFIAGAEETADWQVRASKALAEGEPAPDLPFASEFQKIRAGASEIYVYLPEDYINEAFSLGAKYQKTEITATKAIDAMQALANQISHSELRLKEPFVVMNFLREELASQDAQNETGSDGAELQASEANH